MSENLPALRASDAERDQVVERLRDASAEGRLTLEEFIERMTSAYEAHTHAELEQLTRDLPAAGAPVVSRRRPTRFLLSLFGSTEREGRIRVRRRVVCGAFAAADVYVPEGVEVDFRGLSLFGHTRASGNEPQPRPGTPLVRVFAVSLWAGIDVWRVPLAWSERQWRDVIKGIRSGQHKQLGA